MVKVHHQKPIQLLILNPFFIIAHYIEKSREEKGNLTEFMYNVMIFIVEFDIGVKEMEKRGCR